MVLHEDSLHCRVVRDDFIVLYVGLSNYAIVIIFVQNIKGNVFLTSLTASQLLSSKIHRYVNNCQNGGVFLEWKCKGLFIKNKHE